MVRATRKATTKTILAAAKKLSGRSGAKADQTTAPKKVAKKTVKKAARKVPEAKVATGEAKKASGGKAAKEAAKRTPAQRVAAKKAAKARRLVVQDGETAWTRQELNTVLGELNEHRGRLSRQLQDQEAELVGLMRDAGDGAGQDHADMGATSFERDQELTVVANEREMLAQIDRALARIEDGSYGICESCGSPIGKMRVMAFPRATLCMTCKQREERR
jgi:RNA polymerase-binding protein DksA